MSQFTKMNADIKAQWVSDLRSEKYNQGKHSLKRMWNNRETTHCCLGVLAEQAIAANLVQVEIDKAVTYSDAIIDGDVCTLSPKLTNWSGLDRYAESKLIGFNDSDQWSFEEIADWIEENL